MAKTVKDITDYENLPRSTVCNIIKGFLKTGELNKKEKGGKKHEKMTEDVKQYVRNTVDEDCTISLKNYKHW